MHLPVHLWCLTILVFAANEKRGGDVTPKTGAGNTGELGVHQGKLSAKDLEANPGMGNLVQHDMFGLHMRGFGKVDVKATFSNGVKLDIKNNHQTLWPHKMRQEFEPPENIVMEDPDWVKNCDATSLLVAKDTTVSNFATAFKACQSADTQELIVNREAHSLKGKVVEMAKEYKVEAVQRSVQSIVPRKTDWGFAVDVDVICDEGKVVKVTFENRELPYQELFFQHKQCVAALKGVKDTKLMFYSNPEKTTKGIIFQKPKEDKKQCCNSRDYREL
ncbi:MAG: hypothetical protein KVP17_000682 [Porospora cf. gigantea B]|uniref:uncharacterized protein n=1 Tax=Porospora cf. gigantea B TaxID=2853592 RepID=UPI003571B195|nr:MAG: hypothetical protein KVP17_000682 [Porospora cf. gigantea B]